MVDLKDIIKKLMFFLKSLLHTLVVIIANNITEP